MTIPAEAISPNSTAYGDRQTLEAGLANLGGGASAGAGGRPPSAGQGAPSPGTTIPAQGNPFSALLSGAIKPPNDQPLTSGLSVGPGPGPVIPGPLDNDKAARLKAVAEQSTSPTLRRMAIAQLRRMQRGSNAT